MSFPFFSRRRVFRAGLWRTVIVRGFVGCRIITLEPFIAPILHVAIFITSLSVKSIIMGYIKIAFLNTCCPEAAFKSSFTIYQLKFLEKLTGLILLITSLAITISPGITSQLNGCR